MEIVMLEMRVTQMVVEKDIAELLMKSKEDLYVGVVKLMVQKVH
jgi:hypothetical protein